jgi:plastocyanin
MKRIVTLLATAVAAAFSVATLPADTNATANVVTIDNFSFTPETLTVSPGTKVTWVNQDDVPHTVVSSDKKFKSGVLDTDQRFSYTFSTPGTNDYYCSVHAHMTGRIIVR